MILRKSTPGLGAVYSKTAGLGQSSGKFRPGDASRRRLQVIVRICWMQPGERHSFWRDTWAACWECSVTFIGGRFQCNL